MRQDVSHGINPVQAMLARDVLIFRVDGRDHEFPRVGCPFTLRGYCADKALVLKHAAQP